MMRPKFRADRFTVVLVQAVFNKTIYFLTIPSLDLFPFHSKCSKLGMVTPIISVTFCAVISYQSVLSKSVHNCNSIVRKIFWFGSFYFKRYAANSTRNHKGSDIFIIKKERQQFLCSHLLSDITVYAFQGVITNAEVIAT